MTETVNQFGLGGNIMNNSTQTNHNSIISRIKSSADTSFNTELFHASVLIAITEEPSPKILLCRRASHLKSHPGEVSLPGGKRESIDTDNVSVALRETHEETGIVPADVDVVGELPTCKAKSGLKVKPIIGIIPTGLKLTPELAEVDRLFWVDVQDLTASNIQPYQIKYKGVKVKTPSFQLQDEVIWGLTGRILISFINQTFNQNIKWPFVMLK